MTYQVIARKYRPQTFDEIIGQEPIVRTLKNAIANNLVAHAYIFSGTRGVGKTTTARILAKALNCEKGPTVTPDGTCPACREIAASNSLDVIEVDAASTGRVEEVRELLETARYMPARDRNKIFIIDEAHMLSAAACNALLKTLEEPPPNVIFILATTEPHDIIPTIHSRCQSFHFRNISFAEILTVLGEVAGKEGATVEPEGLAVVARAAEGSLRDALSLLDQVIAYCGSTVPAAQVRELLGVVEAEVLDALVAAVAEGSSEKVLQLVDSLVRDGYNLQHFCREVLRHIRNLLLVRIGGEAAELAEAAGAERGRLEAAAQPFAEEDLLRFFNVLLKTEGEMRWSPHPRLHLELGLLKLVEAERLVPLEEVLAELSNAPESGAPAARNNPAPAPRRAAPAPSARIESAPASRSHAAPAPKADAAPPTPGGSWLDGTTVEAIKNAIYAQSRFLGSFVDQVGRWERQKDSLTLWFAPENRSLSEMLDRKQQAQLEKVIAGVLGEPVKVHPKVGAAVAEAPRPATNTGASSSSPVVQAFLDHFGGSVRVAADVPPPGKSKE